MLHKLFSSKVRIELLNTFFLHPEKSFYLRELERITGEDYKNVSTELKNLESIGLLTSSKSGNLKYFHVNPGFLIYPELKSIFFKVRGAPGLLKQVLSDRSGYRIRLHLRVICRRYGEREERHRFDGHRENAP